MHGPRTADHWSIGQAGDGPRRLTEEPATIVRAMLRNRDHVGSPHSIGRVLGFEGVDIEDSAVQTTIGPHVERRLAKVRRGIYRVPDQAALFARSNRRGWLRGGRVYRWTDESRRVGESVVHGTK